MNQPALRPAFLRYSMIIIPALLGITLLCWTPQAARWTLQDTLANQSDALIDDAIERNFTAFLSVSGVKAILAMLEGSAIGVGFSLQIGDLVQPLYDYVDLIWRALLYALVALGSYKMLLETGLLLLGLQIAGLGLIAMSLSRLWLSHARLFKTLSRRLLLIGILLSHLTPAAVIGARYVCQRYTEPVRLHALNEVNATRQSLTSVRTRLNALKDQVSLANPSDSFDQLRASILELSQSTSDAIWKCSQSFIFLIASALLEVLVFPLLGAFILYKTLYWALGRFLDEIPRAAPPTVPQPAPSSS